MAQLLDHLGRPVSTAKLKQEQAAPTLSGVRQIITEHPAQGLTPGRLAALLRDAEQGDAIRYLELAEEMEEKDLHYLSVMGTRKRQVAQLKITVEPASDDANDVANAELVETFLDREELEDELVDVLDAIGKGYSATEIIWETSERQWMPQRLEWRYPQWFEFDRESGRVPLVRTDTGPEPLAPYKFIFHAHKAKSGLLIRGGLARAAAWGYLFKNFTLKDWLVFVEIYGQPFRVGKYGPAASPDEKEQLLRAVANIGSDAAAIIPQSMLIEFVKTEQRGSADLYEKLAHYIDAQLSKAVLGQTLTTEVGERGSFAASKTHDQVRGDIERSDARQLSATLNRDLARPIVDLNRGPQKAYPRIRIGREEETDIAAMSDALAKLVPLGLRVKQAEVRGKIGLEEPEGEDELLTPPRATRESPSPPGGEGQGEGEPADEPPDDDETPAAARAAAAAQRLRPRDLADDLADEFEPLVADLGDGMIDQIRALIDSAGSLDEVAEGLLALVPDIDPAALADRLREAMALAELMGRSDIMDEGSNG